MLFIEEEDDRELLKEISRLYYSEGRSQAEIARRFSISRSLISKLLKRSREEGIVRISIDTPKNSALSYETRLLDRFTLEHCCVVASQAAGDEISSIVGARAAAYLKTQIKEESHIGLDWGTSLYQMIKQFSSNDLHEGVEIVQLHGVIESASLDIEGFSLAKALGQKLDARIRLLQAPMIVGDVKLKERLVSEQKISEVLEAASSLDIACIGIGTNLSGSNVLTRAGYLSDEESLKVMRSGGTAMISGWFIDSEGELIPSSVNDRIIGLNPESYKDIPLVIAVAHGREKGAAIHAALIGGYIDALITDSDAAREILRVDAQRKAQLRHPSLERGTVLNIYSQMIMTRLTEQRIDELFQEGALYGTTHLCVGQEASSTISAYALEKGDLIFGTHRGHGQALGKGLSVESLFAEMFGKETGCSKGLGGSMHLYDADHGIMGMNGIVAGAVPIAVGAALSLKRRGSDLISAVYFGDGAIHEGAFHEAANIAALWDLPVLFLCENNQYGFSKRPVEVMGHDDIASKIRSYGIETEVIDGNDALAVYTKVKSMRERVSQGGAKCLVLETYRVSGHSKSDKNRYRCDEEISVWQSRCPIATLGRLLIEEYRVTEDELEGLEIACRRGIEISEERARSAADADYELSDSLVYKGVSHE